MVTQLGKILRIIRINTGDSMRKMADNLDLSVSYLSAIENGKRNVPNEFEKKILEKYELTDKEKENLRNAIGESANKVKVNVSDLSEKQRKLIYELTRNQIDESTIDQLCEIIEKKGNK